MSENQQFNTETIVALTAITNKIETLLEKQDEVAINVSKIKEAIYNPDQGIYARLKELENWKETHTKIQWIIATSITILITGAAWNNIIN